MSCRISQEAADEQQQVLLLINLTVHVPISELLWLMLKEQFLIS